MYHVPLLKTDRARAARCEAAAVVAILFLLVAFMLGWGLVVTFLLPLLDESLTESTDRTPRPYPLWLIVGPMAFVTGTLCLTWVTYITAYLYRAQVQPLLPGNWIATVLAATAAAVLLWRPIAKRYLRRSTRMRAAPAPARWPAEAALVVLSTGAAYWLMCHTLHVEGDVLLVGRSVFSDFGQHLALLRSFSEGHNLPTQFPHFADGTARYHFMFQFLAGNLEFLGLPLDWACNLPSILGYVACVLLLYVLAVTIVGHGGAGLITVALFFLRSSPAWWDAMNNVNAWQDVLPFLWHNAEFIGRTANEDGGLWNQNVYANQRHLSFGLATLFLTLILVIPLLRRMRIALVDTDSTPWHPDWWQEFLLTADAWLPEHGRAALHYTTLGLMLGLSAYWNGATFVATLLLLLLFAMFCKHRLSLALIALPALLVAWLQNQFFIGHGQLAMHPHWVVGFLANSPVTLHSIARYYTDLLGPLPLLVFAALVHMTLVQATPPVRALGLYAQPRGWLWLSLVFLAPIVLATTVQFTPDIAHNHKYVLIGVLLLNIVVADFLLRLWLGGKWLSRLLVCVCLFALTATGIIDLRTLHNRNSSATALRVQLHDPRSEWIKAHTDPNALLLTDWYSLHPILLTGRPIYYGWPYYGWSAGYPTLERERVVKGIYGGTDADVVRTLVANAGIDHIVIDAGNRHSSLYTLNEALLRSLYPVEFESGNTVILKAR